MKKLSYFCLIFLIIASGLFAQENKQERLKHHRLRSFRNPFPGYEERETIDYFKLLVWDRIINRKSDSKETYSFPIVENDGIFLQNNKEELSVTWIGHSTLLIQLNGINILTDPIWSERASPVSYAGPKRYVEPGLDFEKLPKIDVVVISHNHYDHLDKKTIQKLGSKPFYIVPLGIGEFLDDLGIKNFSELDWWDTVTFNNTEFVCTPAQHHSGRTLFDKNKTLWCSWLMISGKEKVYFGGDTGYFPEFKKIGEIYGPINVAALPIGCYMPRWYSQFVHMNPEEAIDAFIDLNAGHFVPIHYGTFDLGDEPADEPQKLLLGEISRRDLDPQSFWILKHGETRILSETDSLQNLESPPVLMKEGSE